MFEKFYSIHKLNKSVIKQIEPFGRYIIACLIVTKFDYRGEIISQVNYFELAPPVDFSFATRMKDDDVNYLSELLYSKPA